jgi:hypothetical protein
VSLAPVCKLCGCRHYGTEVAVCRLNLAQAKAPAVAAPTPKPALPVVHATPSVVHAPAKVVHTKPAVVHKTEPVVVHAAPAGGSRHGKHLDTPERRAYRAEWMRRKRAASRSGTNAAPQAGAPVA